MTRVNIAEAKARLSELVDRALAGEEVLISRRDVPLIRLVPESLPASGRLLGLFQGQISLGEGFDDPLPGFDGE